MHTEAEKRQRRLGHDCRRDTERSGDEHGRDHRRQNVARDDAPVARTERTHRVNVFELANHQHLSANEPRHSRPANQADGEKHDGEGRLKRGHERDEEQ